MGNLATAATPATPISKSSGNIFLFVVANFVKGNVRCCRCCGCCRV